MHRGYITPPEEHTAGAGTSVVAVTGVWLPQWTVLFLTTEWCIFALANSPFSTLIQFFCHIQRNKCLPRSGNSEYTLLFYNSFLILSTGNSLSLSLSLFCLSLFSPFYSFVYFLEYRFPPVDLQSRLQWRNIKLDSHIIHCLRYEHPQVRNMQSETWTIVVTCLRMVHNGMKITGNPYEILCKTYRPTCWTKDI
jgi:hypothetical protein